MKVRIYKPHTHAGTRHEPGPDGLEIDIPDHDAKWLKEHTDVCKKPEQPVPTAASAAP